MTRKLKTKHCYHCGAAATSREHAPPQQLFRGIRCDKITVPSCDHHNGDKANRDQAIVQALAISLINTPLTTTPRPPEVQTVLEASVESFEYVKRWVSKNRILRDAPPELDAELSHIHPAVDIEEWMRQLTAALVFDATQQYDAAINWEKATVFSANWLPGGPVQRDLEAVGSFFIEQSRKAKAFDGLHWVGGWPSGVNDYPPEIYAFHISMQLPRVLIRHQVLSQYVWYVSFESPNDTSVLLQKKLASAGRIPKLMPSYRQSEKDS